ncbi:sensor histidine kinase, partial [Streptomyces sp900116325]
LTACTHPQRDGALLNPTASPAEISEAAGVVRQSANQALEDLQDVLRVLRTPTVDAYAEPPQPTLGDIDRLIEEARAASATVKTHQALEDVTTMDPAVGRAAYRILQETLTNHRKHAPDSPLHLSLTGGAREGLTIRARNPIQRQHSVPPGTGGHGLIGIDERAELAGGDTRRVHTATEFSVEVWLPWTR